MNIHIDLSAVKNVADVNRDYDPSLDDVRSLLLDICAVIDEAGGATFLVGGFGQAVWPVDVRTDLPVLLEQLPQAIAAVDNQASFSLDFYEQGIERSIHFEPSNRSYRAQCQSLSSWSPNPDTELMDIDGLRTMLREVESRFLTFVTHALPKLAVHPWLRDWAHQDPE